jgi:hypothetical protein
MSNQIMQWSKLLKAMTCDHGPCWCCPQYRGPFYFCLLVWEIQTFTPTVWAADGARTWTICHARCGALLSFRQFPSINLHQAWQLTTATVQCDSSTKFCTELPLTFAPQLTLNSPLAMFHVVARPTTILSHAKIHLPFHEWLCISLIQQSLIMLWFLLLC